MSGLQSISYSRLLVLDKRMSVREVKLEIFKQLRYLVKMPDIPTLSKERRRNLTDKKLLEEEYNYFFASGDSSDGMNNPLYDIYVNNNIPMDEGYLFNSQAECDLCKKSHKGSNCLFNFKDQITLR